jgi:hypothetical protein
VPLRIYRKIIAGNKAVGASALTAAFIISFCACNNPKTLQQGDLLFQTSSGSGFGNAVENSTRKDTFHSYAHVGIMVDGNTVAEAIEDGVLLTPADSFLKRNVRTCVFRLSSKYQRLIPQALRYCLMQTGAQYDSTFLPDNGKFYCSELICEAFKFANGGNDFFPLLPMTFKANGEFLPFWVEWYGGLGIPIPEGVAGSNPSALSKDRRLKMITVF